MMGRTHAITGLAAGLVVAAATHSIETTPVAAYAVAYGAALLPDLDQYASLAGRHVGAKQASWVLRNFRHRTFTHSILGTTLFAVFAYSMWAMLSALTRLHLSGALPQMAVVGYASHIFADMWNKQGCALFYPFKPLGLEFIPIHPFRALRISTIHDEKGLPWKLWNLQAYLHTEKWFWLYPVYIVIAAVLVRNAVPLAASVHAEVTGAAAGFPGPVATLVHLLFG